jgi:hypothetical protein
LTVPGALERDAFAARRIDRTWDVDALSGV